ncbi:MAG: ABC transporter ATP-binding protein [Actinomycetota bacterium]
MTTTAPAQEQESTAPMAGETLLEARALTVAYDDVVAVDGIDFSIRAGEIVGLAGESGCGKTTVANALMQILRPPARVTAGRILFRGDDVTAQSAEQRRRYRWRNVSMVFQSAMNALNPVMRVGDQFVDMMRAHERVSKRQALLRAGELLDLVGIDARRVRAYPHELSGGMRQRVIVAMALALRPELVIMDEPTTALDVVVQREILQQVRDLQRELGFAVLFITHDLSLLFEVAHRIAIMYAGEIVETAPADHLRTGARHPYTVGLIRSFPSLTGPRVRMTGIPGSPPDPVSPPPGCRFHPRCPHCTSEPSPLHTLQTTVGPRLKVVAPAHAVACHLVEAEG